MKNVRFHPKAIEFIRAQSSEIRAKTGEALRDLQKGMALGLPKSRPMPSVGVGVAELRIKDSATTTRVFYLTRLADIIIVFHAFRKNTKETPRHEIELGKKRLKEMLDG